mmetsp:Transcript_27124/g.59679  ORF Transcript_27124/g.59679 Transcript_27124/m.59679 type:complete len:1082 (-) Transcript_27124:37-3282(-)
MASSGENDQDGLTQTPPPLHNNDSNSNSSNSSNNNTSVIPTIRLSRSFDNFDFPSNAASRGSHNKSDEFEFETSNSDDIDDNPKFLPLNRSFSADDLDAATRMVPFETGGLAANSTAFATNTNTTATTTTTNTAQLSTHVASVASGEILMPKDDSNEMIVPASSNSVSDGDEQTRDNSYHYGFTDNDREQSSHNTREVSATNSYELEIATATTTNSNTNNDNVDEGAISSDDEDDSEVLLAKEMALAIAKNPTMTPTQLRELQQRVQYKMNKKKKDRTFAAIEKKDKTTTKPKKLSSTKIVKETIKETKQNAKAGAKVLKKEFQKGLRAMGLTAAKETTTKEVERCESISSSEDTGGLPNASIATYIGISGGGASANTNTRGIIDNLLVTPRTSERLDGDGEKIRLAGIVWKRRSGLGKYSMTAPWERRRVVLKGTKLIYYKTLQESMSAISDGEEEEINAEAEGFLGASGWINTFMDKTGVNLSVKNLSVPWETSPKPGARGYMDLHKEKASAAASYGHTGAPTPFALSIKVTSITRYKLCFDTQNELMTWLAAISDVVVAGSVDDYNAGILEANDPSSQGGGETSTTGGDTTTTGTWLEPPPTKGPSEQQQQGGHRLWSTERYQVKSVDYPQVSAEEDLEDDNNDFDMGSAEDYFLDTSKAQEIWGLPTGYLKLTFYLMNAVILSARFQTALTDDIFWYVLVFSNVLAVLLINKVVVGGEILAKPGLEGRGKATKKQRKQADGVQKTSSGESAETAIKTTDSPLIDEHFIPPAGSTSIRIENAKDLPTKDGVIFPGWRQVDPAEIPVRGATYKANKKKIPCPGDLYECIELDVFESKKRAPDMAGRVILPTVAYENDHGPKTWNAPDLFVISVSLPTDPPKLYGGSTDNGGGYTITMYCRMRQETRDILRRITADGYNPTDEEKKVDPDKSIVNAARLLDEWCRRAPSDDNWMARFKVIPQGNNLVEIGLPSWISNYNGKPFLIKRPGTTGFLYRHPDKSCMEFDVSLHPFPYLAKQGLCYMKDGFFKKILATLAFCIEGRAEDELPECLIGLFQLCYPNPVYATQAEEFFAGKSARSK